MDPEAFALAESIPPGQLVGHRVWVQGFGPGLVQKFEKAWVGFGTSTHTVRFDNGAVDKLKLRRHGNGKTPFVLITPDQQSAAPARPAKTVFRYVVEEGSDSGSEPVTPSDGAPVQDINITEPSDSQASPVIQARSFHLLRFCSADGHGTRIAGGTSRRTGVEQLRSDCRPSECLFEQCPQRESLRVTMLRVQPHSSRPDADAAHAG